MRLCVTCRHYSGGLLGLFPSCAVAPHPRRITNPVTGAVSLVGNDYPAAQRLWNHPGYCGPEGKNWMLA